MFRDDKRDAITTDSVIKDHRNNKRLTVIAQILFK